MFKGHIYIYIYITCLDGETLFRIEAMQLLRVVRPKSQRCPKVGRVQLFQLDGGNNKTLAVGDVLFPRRQR